MNNLATFFNPPTQLPANMNNRIAALRQQAAHAGEVWQSKAGDCLVGVIIGHQKAVGQYGENHQMLIPSARL